MGGLTAAGRTAVLLLFCSSVGALAAPDCPQPLRIGFNDTAAPPGLMGQGARFAEPPGWEVTTVREALARLGCEAQLVRLPSRRLSASLGRGEVDFALLYGVTPERQQTMRFPLDAAGRPDLAWAPVFGHLVLFGPAGSRPEPGWSGERLAPRWRVGVIAGAVQEAVARERGWTLELVAAADAELAMLQARRFDLLLTTRESLTPQQRAGLVEWAPPVARLAYFMPASPDFVRRHPGWARSFWNEFCRAVRRQQPDVRPAECGIAPPAVIR